MFQAKDAKEGAEKLAAENKGVVDNAERLKNEAENELRKATAQQQIADSLLVDLDSARAKARKSMETADNTVKEAEKTLQTLKGKFFYCSFFISICKLFNDHVITF